MTAPIIGDATSSVSGSAPRRQLRRAPQVPGDTQQPARATSAAQPGTAAPPAPQETFAEMQARGVARPAPPPMQAPQQVGGYAPSQQQTQVNGQLQQSVSEALQRGGSRYGLPEVQKVRDALTSQLEQQFSGKRKQIDEEMARRGIGASSIAGGYYGDLAGQQATAQAGLDADLIRDAAATNAQDLTAAIASGQNFSSELSNQGLADFGANMQATGANNASSMARDQFNEGQYENAAGLALAGASGAQGSHEFDLQQQLAERLGLGGLGLQERSLEQSGRQFQQQFGLSERLGLGGLSLDQARAKLDEQVQTGQLSIAQKNQALAELQNQQQFGMASKQFELSEKLGLGNLSLQQAQQALQEKVQTGQLSIEQARQALAERQTQIQQQQFADQLRQQLGVAQMGDKTANRGIDAQQKLAENDLYLRIAQLLSGMGFPKNTSTGSTGGGGGGAGGRGGVGGGTDDPHGDPSGGGQPIQTRQDANDFTSAQSQDFGYGDQNGAPAMPTPTEPWDTYTSAPEADPRESELLAQLRRRLGGGRGLAF